MHGAAAAHPLQHRPSPYPLYLGRARTELLSRISRLPGVDSSGTANEVDQSGPLNLYGGQGTRFQPTGASLSRLARARALDLTINTPSVTH